MSLTCYGKCFERYHLRRNFMIYTAHTQASDGLLTPEALVHRAVEMRVGTLAITDHDTTDAIPAARAEIARSGLALNLVPGVEFTSGKITKFTLLASISILNIRQCVRFCKNKNRAATNAPK